ncbi:MAG: hypothetical protein V1821_02340 [bacterium]
MKTKAPSIPGLNLAMVMEQTKLELISRARARKAVPTLLNATKVVADNRDYLLSDPKCQRLSQTSFRE